MISRTRQELIHKLWEEEIETITEKKLKEQVLKVPVEIKKACISRYMAACKQQHALAFFSWREKTCELLEANKEMLKAIF